MLRKIICPRAAALLVAVGGSALLANAPQAAETVIDCPLRDAPFSTEIPLMDVMASSAAKALLTAELPTLMKSIPPMFLTTEAPSLSAIMSLRGATELLRMPMSDEDLAALNAKLAAVEVDDATREARCARYDNAAVNFELADADLQVLVFTKINGYDHVEGKAGANAAIEAMAEKNNWNIAYTEQGGAFTTDNLDKFDVVVWNNVSGDVLTLSQRAAFRHYIEQGGGFLGIHGSGGDFFYLWDWYRDALLSAQFIGHTMNPHYQDATVKVEDSATGISSGDKDTWVVHDEWYSFAENPRDKGADIVATVDESSYTAEMSGISLRMGEDHPIAWARCVGEGRSYYTAIGHLPDVYEVEGNRVLLEQALRWTAGAGEQNCAAQ